MKKFLFFFATSILFAQSPICRIIDYSPNLKVVSFGPASGANERCNFFFNTPRAGQMQIACYVPNNPIPVYNSIQTLTQITNPPVNPLPGLSGSWVYPYGGITWLIRLGYFHLVGAGSDGIAVSLDGTF